MKLCIDRGPLEQVEGKWYVEKVEYDGLPPYPVTDTPNLTATFPYCLLLYMRTL